MHVALGDFGTGYSSLALLAHLPFDVVKLDRTLIRSLADESGPSLAAAVVELGRALGLRVIAEGIETREQLHELRRLGYPLGQGYLFAKPMPIAEARRLLGRPVYRAGAGASRADTT